MKEILLFILIIIVIYLYSVVYSLEYRLNALVIKNNELNIKILELKEEIKKIRFNSIIWFSQYEYQETNSNKIDKKGYSNE